MQDPETGSVYFETKLAPLWQADGLFWRRVNSRRQFGSAFSWFPILLAFAVTCSLSRLSLAVFYGFKSMDVIYLAKGKNAEWRLR